MSRPSTLRSGILLIPILLAPLVAQDPPNPSVKALREGSLVEAAQIVREVLADENTAMVPHLHHRLEHPVAKAGRPRRVLQSMIIDAIVQLDHEGDGTSLVPFARHRDHAIKVLSFALREPGKRWSLLSTYYDLHALSTPAGTLGTVAWPALWKHHKERVITSVLAPGAQLSIDVVDPTELEQPSDLVGLGGGAGGSFGTRRRPPPLPQGLGPSIRYELVPKLSKIGFLGGGTRVLDLRIERRNYVIVRREIDGRFEADLPDQWASNPTLRDRLDRKLAGKAPKIASVQSAMDKVVFKEPISFEAEVRRLRQRTLDELDAIIDTCVKRKWISKSKTKELRRVRVHVRDHRSERKPPLPKIQF